MIYEWYGVYDGKGRLVAVEEGEFVADEIRERLGEGHYVQPVTIYPPETDWEKAIRINRDIHEA